MVLIKTRSIRPVRIVAGKPVTGSGASFSKTNLVSVVMPVYNDGAYLAQAIQSILQQTFSHFEFIIIYNPSRDNSLSIIKSFSDPRIRVVANTTHLNLASSLNRGLRICRGQYIARMDADDISLPRRLERQIDFMEKHPDIGACGSWIQCIGYNEGAVIALPDTPGKIKSLLLFHSPLAHPTVIMRRELMLKYGLKYPSSFQGAEDYQLWSDMVQHFHLANIPEVLLNYRMHAEQASRLRTAEMNVHAGSVRRQQLRWLGIEATDEEFALHQAICLQQYHTIPGFPVRARWWLDRLLLANLSSGYCPHTDMETIIDEQWRIICSAYGMQSPA